jgi:hypothetical protein
LVDQNRQLNTQHSIQSYTNTEDTPTAEDLDSIEYWEGGLEPWDRQANETSLAYAAFCVYRDMGVTRSRMRTARQLGRVVRVIEEWTEKHNWLERAQKYDDYLAHQARVVNEKAILEMQKRHAGFAVQLQRKALEKLKILELDDMSPGDLLQFIMQGAKLERQARGVTDDPDKEKAGQVQVIVSYNEANVNISETQLRANYRPPEAPVIIDVAPNLEAGDIQFPDDEEEE